MRTLCLMLGVPLAAEPLVAAELPEAPVGEQLGLELTVYNQNMALVKDQRALTLVEGLNRVRFTDVAAQIDPTSVHFQSLNAPQATVVREQNFQYDLVSRAKLLEKYIDQEIVAREVREGGQVETLSGTLLSARDGLVLRAPDGHLIFTNAERIELPALPEGLITRPTLVWEVETQQAGPHRVEVSYLTNGITWSADYVAVVNPDDTRADLNGWVTLTNQSGATYPFAKLKLIAGEVRRIQPPPVMDYAVRAQARMAGAPQFEEKAFFEYHLYTLQRKTTVRDNETKQVELLTAADVPVHKVYIFDGAQPRSFARRGETPLIKANVMIEFENTEANHLGMALPKGKVRVYKADADGSLQFVGEDEIDHTPRDEKVRLYVGDAFDVVGERKQTAFRQIAERVTEQSFAIDLRNHKDQAIEVTVVEHLAGDWEILKESHPHVQKDAFTLEYHVPVPAHGQTQVTYTVRTQY